MKLRRGFKKEASELAEEVRGELRLGPFDCLDPRRLAQHLEIPIIPLSEYSDICKDAQYLFSIEPDAFSAVTVFDNHQRLIMHNDSHSVPRRIVTWLMSCPMVSYYTNLLLLSTRKPGVGSGTPRTKKRRTGLLENYSLLTKWP